MADVTGHIQLTDPDCEAAAIGHVKVECSATYAAVEAASTGAQGATGSATLANLNLSWGGVGASLPITTGLHGGDDPHEHATDGPVQGLPIDVDAFSFTVNCDAIAYCWANGGWGGLDTASALIKELEGEDTCSYSLTSVTQ